MYYDFSKLKKQTQDKGYKFYDKKSYKIFKPSNFKSLTDVRVIVMLGGMGAGVEYNRVSFQEYIKKHKLKEDLKKCVIISILPPNPSLPFLKIMLDEKTLSKMGRDCIRKKSGGIFNFFYKLSGLENSFKYSRGPSFFDVKVRIFYSIIYNLFQGVKALVDFIKGKKSSFMWRIFIKEKDHEQALNAIDQSAKIISDFLDTHHNTQKEVSILADSQGALVAIGIFSKYGAFIKNMVLKCVGFDKAFENIKQASLLAKYSKTQQMSYEKLRSIKIRLGQRDPIWPGALHKKALKRFFTHTKGLDQKNLDIKVIAKMRHELPSNRDFDLLISCLHS